MSDFMSYTWSDRTKYPQQPRPPAGKDYKPRRHCRDCSDTLMWWDKAVSFNGDWYCPDCNTRNREMTEAMFAKSASLAKQGKKPRHKRTRKG